MHYQVIKSKSQNFIQKHHAYFWGVLELSMLCAAAYSVFGLFLLATGAMASGNTAVMMLEFMIAPLYAAVLFVSVTAALSVILTLPYAIALGLHLPKPFIARAAAISQAKPAKRKPTKATKSKAKRKA